MRWERILSSQAQEAEQGRGEAGGLGKRWAHTCNAIKGGRFLYVFVGLAKTTARLTKFTSLTPVGLRVHLEKTWSQPMIRGTPPAPRDCHCCTSVGDNLFVFGGTDGMKPLGDLHILYTSSHTWISPITRGERPEARQGHSAALVGKMLFIFGGYGKSPDDDDEVYYNDLFIFNTETFVWTKAMATGIPPSPRYSHGCSTWKNKMIVVGGVDGRDDQLSDVHILDADTLSWKKMITTGHMLPPRAGRLTVTFGKILFVYGGYSDVQKPYDDMYILDIESAIWSKVTTAGAGPSPRFSMAGACLDPVGSGVLVFVGGCTRSLEALDDIYYLHTGLATEHERRLEKLPLRKKPKLKRREQNLTPGHDKPLVQVGVSTSSYQPMPLSIYGQPDAQNYLHKQSVPVKNQIFQGIVMESFGDRFTIETIIDGKSLHGILFSSKPGSPHMSFSHSSRKRTFGDARPIMKNGDHDHDLKASKSIQLDSVANGQADDVRKASSQEPYAEPPGANPDLKV